MLDRAAAADSVIVALDCSEGRALELADVLSPELAWVKVGMELFYAAGPALVPRMRERGLRVFLDLKLHDIPNTVRAASRELARLGAGMLTVHASGGPAMVAAAREGLDEGARLAGLEPPRLLAVTVLTSMDQTQLAAVGVNSPVAEQVARLAGMARANGADGVVCSALEASAMRGLLGPGALVVTPGVRPGGASLDDQTRVATPGSAIRSGSTHLVVGRPVTRSEDPRAAFLGILDEVAEAKA